MVEKFSGSQKRTAFDGALHSMMVSHIIANSFFLSQSFFIASLLFIWVPADVGLRPAKRHQATKTRCSRLFAEVSGGISWASTSTGKAQIWARLNSKSFSTRWQCWQRLQIKNDVSKKQPIVIREHPRLRFWRSFDFNLHRCRALVCFHGLISF